MNRKTFIVLHHISVLILVAAAAFKETWIYVLLVVVTSIVNFIRKKTIKKTKLKEGNLLDDYFDAFLHEETLPEKKRQHVMQNKGKNIFSLILHYITMKNKTVSWIIWVIFFIATLLLTLYIASVTKHIE